MHTESDTVKTGGCNYNNDVNIHLTSYHTMF